MAKISRINVLKTASVGGQAFEVAKGNFLSKPRVASLRNALKVRAIYHEV